MAQGGVLETTTDASGRFVIDPNAFQSGGTVAKWIELGSMTPAANPSVLTTTNGLTVAQEILNLVSTLNDTKEQQEKRWGLRPHKISLFTAYDFNEGRLKGFTIGGGWRWRSKNIIGTDSRGAEITGTVLSWSTDFLTYSMDPPNHYGMITFADGGRFMADIGDVEQGQVDSGMKVRMAFRIKDFDDKRGFRRYFWKAVPA